MDADLHRTRLTPDGQRISWSAPLDGLPDGVFIKHKGVPHLIMGDRLLPWSHEGYGAPLSRRRRKVSTLVQILMPKPMVAVLSVGYRPKLHSSAAAVLT
jgi:hypothetical protein